MRAPPLFGDRTAATFLFELCRARSMPDDTPAEVNTSPSRKPCAFLRAEAAVPPLADSAMAQIRRASVSASATSWGSWSPRIRITTGASSSCHRGLLASARAALTPR
jgi:hypothetical protein